MSIGSIDPDICLKVDTALAFSGCTEPTLQIRQFLYVYHESEDFDYQILPALVHLLMLAGSDEEVWNNLLALDLQRDCGLSREEYAAEILAMIDELEILSAAQTVVADLVAPELMGQESTVLEPDLPPEQLSA